MYPYRRGKKRPKGGPPGRRGHDRGPRRIGGGAAYDLLNIMPSTTKALAQMLAGHTRASGQLVHARNILAQAERAIEERQIDRLMPADREDFFEQLARLKLTLADADVLGEAEEAQPVVEAPPKPAMAPERLRELALSLAGELEAGAQRKAEAQARLGLPAAEAPAEPSGAQETPPAPEPGESEPRAGSAHQKPRLRLKRKADLAEAER
jgi:hypothetical protein